MPDHLHVRGARAHNLDDIDLRLPLGAWIALTGPSGSGKTSLAFDVLHREGQRRYLSSLSAKARHYLGKLGRAEADALSGLPVTLATGQGALTPSARSTVGTLSGLLDLMRLWFARSGKHPGHTTLSRAHFSFNQQIGACAACSGLGVEDQIHPPLLIADAHKSIRDGALEPTLANGYTVYSQVTLEVMNDICRAHGFSVDVPWSALSETQRDIIFYGTRALKVPFGKHSIESRMKWEGITARPRESGFYRGLIPVIRETLKRDRNPNILRFVRSVPCSACEGARLGAIGRETRVGPLSLPDLLAMPTRDLSHAICDLPQDPVLRALRPELERRLTRMTQLSLGHLSLDRGSVTLSGGEGQRLRLAAQLFGELGGMLLIVDEPTLGLHPSAQAGMAEILEALRKLGNTLLVVEHDPQMARRADHWLALGPGAGPSGGQVVHNAPMPANALRHEFPEKTPIPASMGSLQLRGATLHNLEHVDFDVPLGALTVVSGPSGAGKSSLVFQTLLPALEGREGGAFSSLTGVPDGMAVQWVDAKPIGRTPRSTPATYTGLFDWVRKRFAATPAAKRLRLNASRFSYNTKAGRCPACEGLGVQRMGLHLLQDVEVICELCDGTRYTPEVQRVLVRDLHIGQVLDLTVDDAAAFFADDAPILALCQVLSQLGLGYLHLSQSSNTLSRGEAQRVKLATLLGKPVPNASLILLDEPDRGLHPHDILRLQSSIRGLVRAGHTVLAISHHPMMWHVADHRFALCDGCVVPPSPVSAARSCAPGTRSATPTHIALRGVRTHNLDNLDVRIRHGHITAIVGVSGSGKSSLALDTLAAVAMSRFAESLPFQVRRYMRQQRAPELDSATGLTPVLALAQGQGRAGPRATVGSLTEIDSDLRLLWSRLGRVGDDPTELSASHFSANQSIGACPSCAGLGTSMRCDADRLITHPERALADGAMAGTKPGAFFGEADGQYIATLEVAAAAAGVRVDGPVNALSSEARDLALYGAGGHTFEVTWDYQRGERTGSHTFRGPWVGLCALVEHEATVRAKRKNAAEWSAPLAAIPCTECDGERLSAGARAVTVNGFTLPQLSQRALSEVAKLLGLWCLSPVADIDEACTSPIGLVPKDTTIPGGTLTRPSRGHGEVLKVLLPRLISRLHTLCELGLGHLTLARPSPTLSTGELQRLRLAAVLDSELTSLTLVVDEPGTGLDETALHQLAHRLRAFCNQGNTVVLVAHRDPLIQCADDVLTLGPGAGLEGGKIVSQGPPTPTNVQSPPRSVLAEHGWLRIRGAHQHNLQDVNLDLPDRGLIAVTGPSGSGKSTLVFNVIGASKTAGRPQGCEAISDLSRYAAQFVTRATQVRTPLATLALLKPIQALFYKEAKASGSALSRSAFSFHSAAGRCPACKGSGQLRVPMDVMADVVLTCPQCAGRRYHPDVLDVLWHGLNVAEILTVSVSSLLPLLAPGSILRCVAALCDVGLAHVSLASAGHVLSGGEHQRVRLAAALAKQPQEDAKPSLLLLDEPGAGLHGTDLGKLANVLHQLAKRGALIVYTTHRPQLIEAAHWRVELGPGGGPQGGQLGGVFKVPCDGLTD